MRDIPSVLTDIITVVPIDMKEAFTQILDRASRTPPEMMHIRAKETKMALKKFLPSHPSELKEWHKSVIGIWCGGGYDLLEY